MKRTRLRNLNKFSLEGFEMDTTGPVEKLLLLEFQGEITKELKKAEMVKVKNSRDI